MAPGSNYRCSPLGALSSQAQAQPELNLNFKFCFFSARVVEVNKASLLSSPHMVMMNGNYSEMIFPAYLVEILGLYWGAVGLEQKIDHNEPV